MFVTQSFQFITKVHICINFFFVSPFLRLPVLQPEYMQEPFEAKGLLFPKSALMRFKSADIAGKKPDGVIGGCDTADKGDDDFCAPFAKVFGPKYFITDV